MTRQTIIKSTAPTNVTFVEASDVTALAGILEQATVDTLVVFDVDMVLLHTEDHTFQMPNLLRHHAILKTVRAELTPEESDLLLHYPLINKKAEIINPAMPSLIQRLQCLHIPTMACTAILSGAIESEPDMMQWRINQLIELGIDFSVTAPDSTLFSTIQFPTYRNNIPQYKDGVMITNGEHGPTHKGTVLTALLKTLSVQPSQIIMIDDRHQNLVNIQSSLEEISFDGDYIAIEFTEAMCVECLEISAELFTEKLQHILTKMGK